MRRLALILIAVLCTTAVYASEIMNTRPSGGMKAGTSLYIFQDVSAGGLNCEETLEKNNMKLQQLLKDKFERLRVRKVTVGTYAETVQVTSKIVAGDAIKNTSFYNTLYSKAIGAYAKAVGTAEPTESALDVAGALLLIRDYILNDTGEDEPTLIMIGDFFQTVSRLEVKKRFAQNRIDLGRVKMIVLGQTGSCMMLTSMQIASRAASLKSFWTKAIIAKDLEYYTSY